jgi:hypothetical protein
MGWQDKKDEVSIVGTVSDSHPPDGDPPPETPPRDEPEEKESEPKEA